MCRFFSGGCGCCSRKVPVGVSSVKLDCVEQMAVDGSGGCGLCMGGVRE